MFVTLLVWLSARAVGSISLLLFLASGFGASGCVRVGYQPPESAGSECQSDADCADGLECLRGYCYQTCIDVVDCSIAGQACYRTVCAPFIIEDCGNGLVEPGEACDDAGAAPGDGCDGACQLENGWACEGEPSACRVSEFWVNEKPFGDQQDPSVAIDLAGTVLIAWTGPGPDGVTDAAFIQRIGADGAFVGTNQIVSQAPENAKSHAAVAAARGGAFVVAWVSDDPHPYNDEVYARFFDADAIPIGDELKVNTTHVSGAGQGHPRIAIDRDDNVLMVWHSWAQDGSGFGVYAQRLSITGELVGPEIMIPQVTEDYQQQPDVAAHDRGFVVVWQTAVAGSIHDDVYFRQLATDGTILSDEILVSQVTSGHQWNPSVAATPSGGFTVGHHGEGVDGAWWSVNARQFAADGSPAGDQFLVPVSTESSRVLVRLAAADDGVIAAVWSSDAQDGDGEGVFERSIAADGSLSPNEVQINDTSTGDQTAPAVAIHPLSYQLVVVWASEGQDGDGWGIYGQRFSSAMTRLGLQVW